MGQQLSTQKLKLIRHESDESGGSSDSDNDTVMGDYSEVAPVVFGSHFDTQNPDDSPPPKRRSFTHLTTNVDRYGPSTFCLSPITSHGLEEYPEVEKDFISGKEPSSISKEYHAIHEKLNSLIRSDPVRQRQEPTQVEVPIVHVQTPTSHPLTVSLQRSVDTPAFDHTFNPLALDTTSDLPEPIVESSEVSEESPLVSLPLEILYSIIEIVYYDENSISINSNLENFSRTIPLLGKQINQLSLCFLYKYTIFNRPHAFDKFLLNLNNNEAIGKYVEYMDFSQFTLIGLGRTGRMNQEIQMVTSTTITRLLSLCPNLIEFLASENIQDDISFEVLDYLFNKLEKIEALDFCGALLELFVLAFQNLTIYQDLPNLTKLSFHDCSQLPVDEFAKILPRLTNLRRLDLNHTSITSTVLVQNLPATAKLTHLSLARCSKLTTKDLILLLTQHPALTCGSLTWLNLQIDLNVVSPLSDVYLLYTVRHLVAPQLRYLNLGGMPITNTVLAVIKAKFQYLQSFSMSHAPLVTYDELLLFIRDLKKLKYADFTGVKCLTKLNLMNLLQTNYSLPLTAIEFDYKTLYDITSGGLHIKISKIQTSFIDLVLTPHVWKFFDNEGRRAWIYKLDPDSAEANQILYSTKSSAPMLQSNLVYYDLETGNKIVQKIKKPDFLKYGLRKINCSIGYHNLKKAKRAAKGRYLESNWPVEFSQRGIYNYYLLNIK